MKKTIDISKYKEGIYVYPIYKIKIDIAYKNRKEIEPYCVFKTTQDLDPVMVETFDNKEEAEKKLLSDDCKPEITRYDSYYGGERFKIAEFYLAKEKIVNGNLECTDDDYLLRDDWYYDIDDNRVKFVSQNINTDKLKKYLYDILEIKETEEITGLDYFLDYIVYFNDPKIRKMYTEDVHYLAGNIEVSIGLKDYDSLCMETINLFELIHLDKIYNKYVAKDNIILTRKLLAIIEGVFDFELEII